MLRVTAYKAVGKSSFGRLWRKKTMSIWMWSIFDLDIMYFVSAILSTAVFCIGRIFMLQNYWKWEDYLAWWEVIFLMPLVIPVYCTLSQLLFKHDIVHCHISLSSKFWLFSSPTAYRKILNRAHLIFLRVIGVQIF